MKRCLPATLATFVTAFCGLQPLVAQPLTPYGPAAGYRPMASPAQGPAPPPAAAPRFGVRPVAANKPAGSGLRDIPTACQSNPSCNVCSTSTACLTHGFSVWGEHLYLRPRNAEVAFGVPVATGSDPTRQVGRIGMTDPDYNSGVRLGLEYVLDGLTSVSAQYSWFESTTDNAISAPEVGAAVEPLVGVTNDRFSSAMASHRLRFDWVDLDYRRVIDCVGNQKLTFLAGTRLGQYTQEFNSHFSANGTLSAMSEIDFDGAGLRLGLEGERYTQSRRWFVYGKTAANLVAGEFTADYNQSNPATTTQWEAGRIVPMLDLELGTGWQSRCGTWRISGGYLVSAWYNTVTTDEWLDAVDKNSFVGLSDTMTFDGVVIRCEARF